MSMETDDPRALVRELLDLRAAAVSEGRRTEEAWGVRVERKGFELGLHNLAHYLAVRRRDLRDLQTELMPWGLSSLGRLESRVLPNLDAVIATLGGLDGEGAADLPDRPSADDFFAGERLLERNTDELFGPPHRHRRVRIMVTLPSEAGEEQGLVRELVAAGADCLRINCAHDSARVWAGMVAGVRRAASDAERPVRVLMDLAGQKVRTTEVVAPVDGRRLFRGDLLLLTTGRPVVGDGWEFAAGCSTPEVLQEVSRGTVISFDDGHMETVVREKRGADALLEVIRTRPKGMKLRSGRGINVPGVRLPLDPLTPKDVRDLDFVAENADMVGYSFVQSGADVRRLQEELDARGRHDMPVVAKIETAAAVVNLPEIIVQAASRQPFAVMIARGDLAIELGYRRLAEMQEELLWLCEAAHVPVIWATEVLDRLARRGMPTRAEVTDAAASARAECVMLNKGPEIVEAVRMLDDLLTRMQAHQNKKTPRLRALRSWSTTD